jgi:hypothetical protein
MQSKLTRLTFALLLLSSSAFVNAQSYHVKGTASGVIGSGLQLFVSYSATCLDDDQSFTLNSTNTKDCTTSANIKKCCSQSIKFTAFNGISTVTCTCGVIVVGRLPNLLSETDTTITTSVPKNATTFAFASAIPDISAYVVGIQTAPTNPIETCTIANGAGVLNGKDITNVAVTCSDRIFRGTFN